MSGSSRRGSPVYYDETGFDDDNIHQTGENDATDEREEPTDEQVLRGMEDVATSDEAPHRRRAARGSQPKLNEATLCSEKGIPRIPKLLEDFKHRSSLDEYANLDLLMNRLEHWAHCLFPKMAFDDFIARAEVLGHKRPVQTCLSKIRMGLPLLDEDFENENREEEPSTARSEADQSVPDELPVSPLPCSSTLQSSAVITDSPPSVKELTEEQKQRAEANRNRALELRRLRMERTQNSQSTTLGNEIEDIASLAADYNSIESEEDRLRQQEQLLDEDELMKTLEEDF